MQAMSSETKIILQALTEHGRQGIDHVLRTMPYDTLILHIQDMTAQGLVDSVITDMADGSELLEYCEITPAGREHLQTLQSTIWDRSIKWLKDKDNAKWVLGSLLVPLFIWAMDKLLF